MRIKSVQVFSILFSFLILFFGWVYCVGGVRAARSSSSTIEHIRLCLVCVCVAQILDIYKYIVEVIDGYDMCIWWMVLFFCTWFRRTAKVVGHLTALHYNLKRKSLPCCANNVPMRIANSISEFVVSREWRMLKDCIVSTISPDCFRIQRCDTKHRAHTANPSEHKNSHTHTFHIASSHGSVCTIHTNSHLIRHWAKRERYAPDHCECSR